MRERWDVGTSYAAGRLHLVIQLRRWPGGPIGETYVPVTKKTALRLALEMLQFALRGRSL